MVAQRYAALRVLRRRSSAFERAPRSNARDETELRLAIRRSDGTIDSGQARANVGFLLPSDMSDGRSRNSRNESRSSGKTRLTRALPYVFAPNERARCPRLGAFADFGLIPRGADAPRGAKDSDPASPKRPPRASPSPSRRDAAAAAADFAIRDNARLALELKQEELTKLRARLSATEDALRRHTARNAELETRLSEHEGHEVATEAEALSRSLAAATRDVRGFFSSGGKVDAAKPRATGDALPVPDGLDGHDDDATFGTKRDGGVLRSGLKKKAPNGRPASSGRGVTFAAESEQKRLEEEGEYVAKLREKTAENEALVARLSASETSLERKRDQMRVAKASYEALRKRLEEETRRREDAERRGPRASSGSSSERQNGRNDAVRVTETRDVLRDVLSVTAHACGVAGRADSRAVTSALPALAALARDGPGETALELLTETRVLEHITRVFELHDADAQVAASVCATLAALVAGARFAAAEKGAARGSAAEAVERGLAASGGLARVVSRALTRHRSSPETCARACDLIHALCHARGDGTSDPAVGPNERGRTAERVSELVRAGCAARVVDAAERHPSDEDAAASAARAIVSMVQHGTAGDARSIAQCGAAAVVRRAERFGLETGLRRAGRGVESWVRENAGAVARGAEPAGTARTPPRPARPGEAARAGSGFESPSPRVALFRGRQSGGFGATSDDEDGLRGDGTDRRDAAAESEDDFDDARFDHRL